MTTLSDYTDAVDALAPGSHPLTVAKLEAGREKAVKKAMSYHSKHKPVEVVEDINGNGGFDYALPDLSAWSDGFSTVLQVEYPVDDTDETPDILEEDEWLIYQKPDGRYIRFTDETPQTGESFRVTYTARHTCDVVSCSVDANDEEAVQSLAAGFFCRILSAAYALDNNSTVDADVVNHSNNTKKFDDLAVKYRKEYNDHMDIDDDKPSPSCHVQDQDVNYPGGMDRITHPRRYR